jgi:hypothetical protein
MAMPCTDLPSLPVNLKELEHNKQRIFSLFAKSDAWVLGPSSLRTAKYH